MATTHIFIVNKETFPIHLQYMFAGTGLVKKDKFKNGKIKKFNHKKTIDINDCLSNNKYAEIFADISRIRVGDKILFYVMQDFAVGESGKFYGVFKAKSELFFDDNSQSNQQKLSKKLNKILPNRILIEADEVYENGIEEWNALDDFSQIPTFGNIQTDIPLMQWSLIYRKLKGNRGCTMISEYESSTLCSLLKRNNNQISATNFDFDNKNFKIIQSHSQNPLQVSQNSNIDIFPETTSRISNNKAFEAQLQMYIIQRINRNACHQYFNSTLNISIFGQNIQPTQLWIGNEVSCGFGMRSIDILLVADIDNSKEIFILELKSKRAGPKDLSQIQRYIKWVELYLTPTISGNIKINPIIISLAENQKTIKLSRYNNFLTELNNVNSAIQNTNSNPNISGIRHVQFKLDANNSTLKFF